jgi:hypothetical protein
MDVPKSEIKKHPGHWIDNIFYSDILATRWMENLMTRKEMPAILDNPETETLSDVKP